MYSFSKYKDQYKSNLRLALPVVLTQLGQILTQVADNLMVGRYGGDDPVPLAAVSFGGAVFFILFIAAIGIALGMTPLVGELYAQGDREKSAGLLQNGILFYTLLGFAMAAVQYAVIPLMYDLGQPVEVVDMAIPYYKMLVFSMPFVMLFFAFKQFLEGVGNTKVEMVVTIIANMANIGFNAVFIYGRFGLPEMGAEGAGLGTLLSRIIAPILMIGYFYNRHKYRGYLDGFSPRNYSWATVKNLLHMGLPISMQMFLEASAFVGTGIMMGWFGKETMSANQIAVTIGNCAFMIVMSIGARVALLRGPQQRGAVAGGQGVVPPDARLERFCSAGLHHHAQHHPDVLLDQPRGDRHRFATAGLRGALPAFGRHPECLGRHPARHTGRENHHADRLRILLAAEPAGGLPVRLHARHGSDGAFPRLLVRLVGRGRDDDRPHPAQRPQAPPGKLRQRFRQSGRRIKKISYLYANYAHKWTPKNNIRKSVNPK